MAHRRVMLGLHAVLPVIESELAEVRLHLLGRAEAAHDPDEGVEQAVTLGVHRGREHGTELRVFREQAAIEIGYRAVASLINERESMGYGFGTR